MRLPDALPSVVEHAPLARYTTFKVGGPARYLFEASSHDDIVRAVSAAREARVPFVVLGGGSNVLVSDKGFDGLVIRIRTNGVSITGEHARAEAGTSLQRLIQETIKAGLTGLEYLMGIPGSVGGAIAGNAGTSQRWTSEFLSHVWFLNADGKIQKIPTSACNFSYRFSRFKNSVNEIVLAGEFDLRRGNPAEIRSRTLQFIERRKHQPSGDACAGCIFKNPSEKPAGQLIDEAGLKGKTIGGACVSEEHGNFIVNTGNATAEDIVILISYLKQQVRDRYGIQLHEEVKYIGF